MILRNESYCFCTRQCHVTLLYREPLSFFGHCHVSFPYMERISFFGSFVQLTLNLVFSDSFVKITTQLKGASAVGSASVRQIRWQPLCYKEYLALTQNSQKKVFLFQQIPMKNTLFEKTTALPIRTTRRVSYPLVNIILYYLEMLKSY